MTTVIQERQERIKKLQFDYKKQPMKSIVKCNLCGFDRFVVLTHRDRYGYPAKANGCLRCGLVWLNPVFTEEGYRQFYIDVYRPLVSAYHGRKIDAETIVSEQNEYAVDRAELLSEFLQARTSKTLLDIGGSTGVVAHYFSKRFGLKATVLDPAPMEIEKAQKLGLTTISTLLEDFDPKDQKFDLIILCQTVDHLLDVGQAVRKIRQCLNPQGLFFVDIVDFRAAYLRNWSVEEAIKIDHPYYLTEQTMTAYLHQAGFSILKKDYAADHLHVSFVCQTAEPDPKSVPAESWVSGLWEEIRKVQNLKRPV